MVAGACLFLPWCKCCAHALDHFKHYLTCLLEALLEIAEHHGIFAHGAIAHKAVFGQNIGAADTSFRWAVGPRRGSIRAHDGHRQGIELAGAEPHGKAMGDAGGVPALDHWASCGVALLHAAHEVSAQALRMQDRWVPAAFKRDGGSICIEYVGASETRGSLQFFIF